MKPLLSKRDVMIRRWSDGKDGALDITVTGSLARTNVEAAVGVAGLRQFS